MFNTPFVISFALLLSSPLLVLFVPKIFPPKHVEISIPDELDDLALFRRATLASIDGVGGAISRLGTSNPRMKIAFLFLTNTNLHFAPLRDKFRHTGGRIFKDRFIAAKRTQRASPTLISAARRLMATALLDDPLNSYFALVSQYCIPLHSFNFIYNSLYTSQFPKYQSFIQILSNESYMWDRYIARGESAMLPEVPFDRHALVVIRDRRLWRKFRMPCLNEDSCYPEEHYFPTLLSMEDPEGCTQYTRHVSIGRRVLMDTRKIFTDCLKPLMDIADKVIFRD
ncbi:unnamed protein product [Withania somnifera]